MKRNFRLDWNRPEGEDWKRYESTQRLVRDFGLRAAPMLFTWLEWCTLLAILHYAEQRTQFLPLTVLRWIIIAFLWLYMMTLLSPRAVKWYTPTELRSRRLIASIIGSFAITYAFVFSSGFLADIFMSYPLG